MMIVGTQANETLQTTADGQRLDGLGGNDHLKALHQDAVLSGGTGNDIYRLEGSGATIVEEPNSGLDKVVTWDSIILPDNVENVDFRKIGGWHSVEGNALANVITSGGGMQAIVGHGGNDTMTGGAGQDTFYFHAGDGHDRITDFSGAEDRLILWSPAQSTLQHLLDTAVATPDGLVLHLSADQSVTLVGVTREDLTPQNVVLARAVNPIPQDARLVWADEFTDSDPLTSGLWNTRPVNGHPVFAERSHGKREHSYVDTLTYTDENGVEQTFSPFSVEDGVLSISARRATGPLSGLVPEQWISGQLDTHGRFAQTYGYYEISARLPAGQGLWPAFWLIADDYSWPPEIDLLDIMGDQTNLLRPSVHTSLWGDQAIASDKWLVPDMSASFHTYGMLWSESEVSFYFNGIEIFSVATPPDMHRPMAMILNLAVGGWTGGSDATTPEDEAFEIDYVRVYELPEGGAGPRDNSLEGFADLENGVVNVGTLAPTTLYGDLIFRADPLTPDLRLAEGVQGTLVGDAASNLLEGNALGTVMNGRAGHDLLLGGAGNDYLIGEDGADTIDGGLHADTLVGGSGDDTYVVRRADGAFLPVGELLIENPGEGFDTLHFVDLTPQQISSHIDWARWRFSWEGPAGTQYLAVRVIPAVGGTEVGTLLERIVFADGTIWMLDGGLTLRGNGEDNANQGTRFDDSLHGGAGNDTMAGMDGADTLDGGQGVDDLYGWNGNDILSDSGAEGGDRLYGEAGDDLLTAGRGLDLLFGGQGNDTLRASLDGDRLEGGDGADSLRGNAGADTLLGGTGDDSLNGAAGQDSLQGGAGQDRLAGNDGADTLIGDDGQDLLNGGAGDDLLSGGAGADSLSGGTGADTLDGGAGADRLRGEAGQDVFRFALSELDGDQIVDFEGGERIEIYGDFDADQIMVSVSGRLVTLTDLAQGDSHMLRVTGAADEDIWLMPF